METQSLLASAYKDLCEYSTSEESKFRYADLAIARYEEAYNAQILKSSGKVEDLKNSIIPASMWHLCTSCSIILMKRMNMPRKPAKFAWNSGKGQRFLLD